VDRRLGVVAIALCSVAAVLPPLPAEGAAPDPPPFRIHDLGTLGGEESWARGINESGVIVGGSEEASGTTHAFLRKPTVGQMEDLRLGVADAVAVNESGVVTGSIGVNRVFAWHPVREVAITIGPLPAGSHVHALNDDDAIVGFGGTQGFIWRPASDELTEIGTLGGSWSDAEAINNAGVIAGDSEVAGGDHYEAYVRDATTGDMTALGTLGGTWSTAWGINDAGAVVGQSDTVGAPSAFVWDPVSGDMTDIDELGPFDGHWDEALDINESGIIVGNGELTDGSQRGLVFDPATGETTVLEGLGGNRSTAAAINDAGMIVGWARTQDGHDHAVLWVPDFSDVPLDHPFLPDISWMATRRIAGGFLDGTFRPGETVTRQAAAAFLYRLAGSPAGADPTCGSAPFDDVGVDHPFCGEIAWLAGEGIADGYPDGGFHPDGTVTRQATAAFLYRLAGNPNGDPPICSGAPFADVDASHPFCREIEWMADAGISDGYPDGTFRPAAPVTRQAASAFLHRFSRLP
jgi:probable HAF family extracellular repeat protein